jgi:DNA-directed RNA polymerase specialized sigma subunit
MITCGKRRIRTKNEIVIDEVRYEELERVVASLVKRHRGSVYSHEIEDLKQTIWYLVLKAKEKYNPNRKVPFEAWAYYYARMKLRDHFWRGSNLPGTKGSFTLLHIKAERLYE